MYKDTAKSFWLLWPLTMSLETVNVQLLLSTFHHPPLAISTVVCHPSSTLRSLPPTVNRPPSTTQGLPPTVCHPPSTTHGLPFTIYHLMSTACRPPLTVYHSPYHPPSTDHSPLSTVRPPSTVHPLPTTIYHLAATIYCLKFKKQAEFKFSKFAISIIRSCMNIIYL